MNDKIKILCGLAIFLVLITVPVWSNLFSKTAPKPVPVLTEKAKAAKECVASKEYMTTEHMQLLDEWREMTVREGKRVYESANGKTYNVSLTNTCLDCHSNKADFCDKCHNYASVKPYCWDCHNDNPKETK